MWSVRCKTHTGRRRLDAGAPLDRNRVERWLELRGARVPNLEWRELAQRLRNDDRVIARRKTEVGLRVDEGVAAPVHRQERRPVLGPEAPGQLVDRQPAVA